MRVLGCGSLLGRLLWLFVSYSLRMDSTDNNLLDFSAPSYGSV